VWTVPELQCLRVFSADESKVLSVAVAGGRLFAATQDCLVKVRRCVRPHSFRRTHRSRVGVFLPVQVWELATGEFQRSLTGHNWEGTPPSPLALRTPCVDS
jgi:hypothetical protein